jgi:hypothetical protein
VHFSDLGDKLAEKAIAAFYRMRQLNGIEKRPATRELINWIRALQNDPDFHLKQLSQEQLPFLGVLFKKSQDFQQAAGHVQRRGRY